MSEPDVKQQAYAATSDKPKEPAAGFDDGAQAHEPTRENRNKKPVRSRYKKNGKLRTHHIRVIVITFLVVIIGFSSYYIFNLPTIMYNGYKNAVLNGSFSGSPMPMNTLYTVPDVASPASTTSSFLNSGANQDVLYTGAWLDLSNGPLVLTVPDTGGRYYSIQLINPKDGSLVGLIGKRLTGTEAGTFLITPPGWDGTVPENMSQISSTNKELMLLGRMFVADESDVEAAYTLSTQITLTPLES